MTTLSLRKGPAGSLDVDAIVVGITGSRDRGALRLAPGGSAVVKNGRRAKDSDLAEVFTSLAAGTGVGSVTRAPAPAGAKAPVVLAVGLGPAPADGAYDLEVLRRAAGAAARALAGCSRIALALPATSDEQVEAVGIGALLGAYSFDRYRTADGSRAPVEAATVVTPAAKERAARTALDRAERVAAGVGLARDLVNTTASELHPSELADAAVRAGKEHGLKVQVLDEQALAKGGYGGLTAVGQGSANPPRLVRVAYSHPRAKRTLALCGKGITFDSGGLSLKPTDGMTTMKCDMPVPRRCSVLWSCSRS